MENLRIKKYLFGKIKSSALFGGRNVFMVVFVSLFLILFAYNRFYPKIVVITKTSPLAFPSPFSRLIENTKDHQVPPESTILDLKNFQFVNNNVNICAKNSENQHLVLFVIHSARENFKGRQTIRETWGSISIYKNWRFRTIFLLGLPSTANIYNISIETTLETEIQNHQDIIIGNFIDSYRNMTYKHLMGYKWILDFCASAKVVVRADDDMFIDIFGLSDFLSQNLKNLSSLICYAMRNRIPERSSYQKWAVSQAEYKSKKYPDYCLGAAYITTPFLISQLFSVSDKLKYFWIDDVFVTGMLRTHSDISDQQIQLTDISSRFLFLEPSQLNRTWNKLWIFVLVDRKHVPYVFSKLWLKLTSNVSELQLQH